MNKPHNPARYGIAWEKGTCFHTGKSRYRSEYAAREALADILKLTITGVLKPRPKHEIRAFACTSCRGYHLTSQPEPGV